MLGRGKFRGLFNGYPAGMPKRQHHCGSSGPWGLKQDPGEQPDTHTHTHTPELRQNLGPQHSHWSWQETTEQIHPGSPAQGAPTGAQGLGGDRRQGRTQGQPHAERGWSLQTRGDSARQGASLGRQRKK